MPTDTYDVNDGFLTGYIVADTIDDVFEPHHYGGHHGGGFNVHHGDHSGVNFDPGHANFGDVGGDIGEAAIIIGGLAVLGCATAIVLNLATAGISSLVREIKVDLKAKEYADLAMKKPIQTDSRRGKRIQKQIVLPR